MSLRIADPPLRANNTAMRPSVGVVHPNCPQAHRTSWLSIVLCMKLSQGLFVVIQFWKNDTKYILCNFFAHHGLNDGHKHAEILPKKSFFKTFRHLNQYVTIHCTSSNSNSLSMYSHLMLLVCLIAGWSKSP